MFNVDDVDELPAKLSASGAELIGEMRCEDAYRPAPVRGPEEIMVRPADQMG